MKIPKSETAVVISRINFEGNVNKKGEKREVGFVCKVMKTLILGLILIYVVEFGFSWVVSRVLQPKLSKDLVRDLGEKPLVLQDLNERFGYLNIGIKRLVGEKNLNGSFLDSTWEINQAGLLLNSQCILYNSAVEEVSIWGWPLQTAGLLTTTFSCQEELLSGLMAKLGM